MRGKIKDRFIYIYMRIDSVCVLSQGLPQTYTRYTPNEHGPVCIPADIDLS